MGLNLGTVFWELLLLHIILFNILSSFIIDTVFNISLFGSYI